MFPRKAGLQSISSSNEFSLKVGGTCDNDADIEITTENEFSKYATNTIQKPIKKKLLSNLTGYIYPSMD